ncbi:MAG: hypothetical protein ACOYNY_40340 [Caldilineaceae bacterium]
MELTTIGWVLVGIGFLPWRIGWRTQRKSVYMVTIQAAFWRLRVEQGNQGRQWQLTLPLVVRLKGAIWSALQTLIKG